MENKMNLFDELENVQNIFEISAIPGVDGAFIFGSYLYGNNDEYSDRDFCIITELVDDYELLESHNDFHIMNLDYYKKLLKEHNDMALSMYFQRGSLKNFYVEFNLNLPTLRKFFSTKANNSFVKAKKKFLQGDIRLAYKSMFHSLRLLKWGINIATGNGNNYDYLIDYNKIKGDFLKAENWDILKDIYKPQFNKYATKFRLVAPKE